jgi:hypothetical protein
MARTDYVPYTTGLVLYAKPLPLTTGTWAADAITGVEITTTGDYAFTLTDDAADYRVFERLTGTPLITDTKVGTLPIPVPTANAVSAKISLDWQTDSNGWSDGWLYQQFNYPPSELVAVKAKTDQLTFTVANQVDANMLTGGGGDGDYSVTVTVVDSVTSDLIQGARVTLLTDLGVSTSASAVTGTLGTVELRADAGDYLVAVTPPTGYAAPANTATTVSADTDVGEIQVVAITIAGTDDPVLCTVAVDVVDQHGEPYEGARVLAYVGNETSIASDSAVIDVTNYHLTDANGRATFNLIRSSEFGPGSGEYTIEVSLCTGRKFYMTGFVVPDQESVVATINVAP